MGSQKEKDPGVALLKVVLHFLNENMDDLDLVAGGRPMRLEDLDNLTSPQMLKIVTFLLQNVIGEKPISKTTAMARFNNFNVGYVQYDCGIDIVYHAVKKIFPEGSDLFHFSVLLLPAQNPKRTKAVIAYIMSFVLMCDTVQPDFTECYEQFLLESEQQAGICNEIADLKEKIAATIQEKACEEGLLPSLRKELTTIEENIKQQQNVLGRLTSDLERHMKGFKAEETVVKKLEYDLQRVCADVLTLENQLVMNPEALTSEYESVKKQLEREKETRKTLGIELEKCTKGIDGHASLLKLQHHVIQGLESAIALMATTRNKLESFVKNQNDSKLSAREAKLLRENLHQLQERHSKLIAEVDKTKLDMKLKVEEIGTQELHANEQTVKTLETIEFVSKEILQIQLNTERMVQIYRTIEADTLKQCDKLTSEIPSLMKQEEEETQEVLEGIKETLIKYPLPLKDFNN